MVKISSATVYVCEVCGREYASREEAERCEASHRTPTETPATRYEYI